jgi:hypothetical protein
MSGSFDSSDNTSDNLGDNTSSGTDSEEPIPCEESFRDLEDLRLFVKTRVSAQRCVLGGRFDELQRVVGEGRSEGGSEDKKEARREEKREEVRAGSQRVNVRTPTGAGAAAVVAAQQRPSVRDDGIWRSVKGPDTFRIRARAG